MPASDTTIFAPASGSGRAGIAVIRVSGPAAAAALRAIAGSVPPPRRAVLRSLRHPRSNLLIDSGLVLWMPGPNSFTGEDQAEFHVHGGIAVRAAFVSALRDIPGCRPAEPGEFTRRAFRNERMDLSAVEGLADLIDAETEAQRQQALWQAEGGLRELCEAWREGLLLLAARVEAGLDFSDEGDVSEDVAATSAALDTLRGSLRLRLSQADRGERLRDGFVVVIAGPPNAGKSTLFNALAQRDVAIVSDSPGTTRDALEIRCDLGGLPVVFVDTAGLREVSDAVEREGIKRARRHMDRADLLLWLMPPEGMSASDASGARHVLTVATKADLGFADHGGALDMAVSALTGDGMDALIERVRGLAEAELRGSDGALLTRERHRLAVQEAVAALDWAGSALYNGQDELAAEDIRVALTAIGRITGRVDVEDVLDRVFAQFCIGK